MSTAKIISYNALGETVCASAARISTTKGNALEVFDNSDNVNKNRSLIEKVLRSGHKSIIEHAVFSIAFENVSVFVEEFFIERRLASFTVKSRRYVDFSDQGYYIPEALEGTARNLYCEYMDKLFEAYQFMLDNGVPKEDARFLLPYSFHSNFYCTINARELSYIIKTIMSDDFSDILELRSLAKQLIDQLEELFPSILSELNISNRFQNHTTVTETDRADASVSFVSDSNIGTVDLIQAPTSPKQLLTIACHVNQGDSYTLDLQHLLQSQRPRELEQLTYTFVIHNISLAGITHIVRHRMQSIIVPEINRIYPNKMIVPSTIKQNSTLLSFYQKAVFEAETLRNAFLQHDVLAQYSYYYILSGNLTDIITTINARELIHFIQLRSCNRAQWEIRNISIRMLKYLRDSFPELFHLVGPSCYMSGSCPEGRLSCGRRNEVVQEFKRL